MIGEEGLKFCSLNAAEVIYRMYEILDSCMLWFMNRRKLETLVFRVPFTVG